MKINLPEQIGKYIRKYLDSIGSSSEESFGLFDRNSVFLQEELDAVVELNLKFADVRYLDHFPNLATLVVDHFPSITDSDLETIVNNCPNLRTLVIKNQNEITTVDVSKLTKLRCLALISNSKLTSIRGLEELNDFDNFELYGNKSFNDVQYILDILLGLDKSFVKIKMDLIYYPATISYIDSSSDREKKQYYDYMEENFIWSEIYGFREPKSRYYSTGEVKSTYEKVMEIIDSVVDRSLSDKENFVRLYVYLVNNLKIPFITLNKNYNSIDGTCNGIQNMETTASFAAKILQFMLKTIGINSEVIDVYTPLYDVKKIGAVSSDYSVLRTYFDEYSFSDLALDIVTTEFNGEPSFDGMLVGIDDITRGNKIVHCSLFEPSVGISTNERESLVTKAVNGIKTDPKKKELEMDSIASSVLVEVAKDNIKRFYTLMSSDSVTLSDYLSLKKKISDARRTINRYSLLNSSSKSLFNQYKNIDVFESKAYIERTLGISIDPRDRSVRDQHGNDYPLKSHAALMSEKDKLISQVNRDEQIGIIGRSDANKLKSKIEYVYGYFLRNASQEVDMDEYFKKIVDRIGSMLETFDGPGKIAL